MEAAATPEGLDITAVTAKGNSYKVAVYVDPYPENKGTDRVQVTCWKCLGRGTVSWGNVTFRANGTEDRHCFTCLGKGYTTALVSSLRSSARRLAKSITEQNAADADWAAEAPAREAAEAQARQEAEAREATRQAGLPKGFLGEAGERLRNLNAKVTGTYGYEGQNYITGAPEWKVVVKFDVLGKTAVWFTSYTTLEEGQFVSLTGTVKALNNRDGEDQTILTRCLIK